MDTNSKIEPLDLSTFTGFTPGPWAAFNRDGEYLDESGLGWDVIGPPESSMDRGQFERGADARLIAAAPALLAECRRQREEIARLRGALEQLLSAAEHLSGASVASYGSGYAIPQETRDAARAALAQGAE